MTHHSTVHLDEREIVVEWEHEPTSGDGWNEPQMPEALMIVDATEHGEPVQLSDAEQSAIARELWPE